MITLKDWQKEAISAIESTLNKQCIIEASTGSGKSIIPMKLIEKYPNDNFIVVIPTIVLLNQWKRELIKFDIAKENEISLIGGGNIYVPGKKVTIAVINSLRNVNWTHKDAKFKWAFFDECHKMCADENIKILEKGNFYHKIGLTATLRRPDGKEQLLIKNIGPVVFRLTDEQSKDLDYVADYDLTLSKVQLDKEEAEKYIVVENNVRMYMSIFNNNYKLAQTLVSKRNFRHALYRDAVKLVKYIQERKSFLVNVKSKKDKAIELVTMNIGKKIILFDELSDSANEIYRRLQNLGLNPVIYHSGIGKKEKTEAINKFTSGESTILVSVKALDEGMDVKDADVGIVVNGNRQERQIKQRLGRILRKKDDKKAMLYMLYVENTQDSKTMLNRMQYIKTADNIYYE